MLSGVGPAVMLSGVGPAVMLSCCHATVVFSQACQAVMRIASCC